MTTGPEPATTDSPSANTYLVIDGENIDATLGSRVLGRRPEPDERPRWDRLLRFAEERAGQQLKSFFFINASSGSIPAGFVQALVGIGLRPFLLASSGEEKVVDVGIERTLDAILERGGDVLLVSHDGDFLTCVQQLLDDDRRVGVIAFPELVSAGYSSIDDHRFELIDLEDDVGCFNQRLPRLRIISLEDFDPFEYL